MTAKFIVFDTETTGLPPRAAKGAPPIPATDPRQPRLASFGAIIADEQGKEISRVKKFIKPEGWTMEYFTQLCRDQGIKAAVDIHGLTDDILNTQGVPVQGVLDYYSRSILRPLIPVAFNAVFDLKIMRGELRRAGMDDLFEQSPNICAMKALDPFGADGLCIRNGFVKLSEAAEFFGIPLDNHEVMSDTNAACKLLEIIIAAGHLPEATIKRAKGYVPNKGAAQTPGPAKTAAPLSSTPQTGDVVVPDSF